MEVGATHSYVCLLPYLFIKVSLLISDTGLSLEVQNPSMNPLALGLQM